MQSQKERESFHKLHERFRVLKDLLRDTVIVRQIERERDEVWRKTYADRHFLLAELPFCRQSYKDHNLAYSAPHREQHVCLGEEKTTVGHSKQWPYIFVLKLGLLKYTAFYISLLKV